MNKKKVLIIIIVIGVVLIGIGVCVLLFKQPKPEDDGPVVIPSELSDLVEHEDNEVSLGKSFTLKLDDVMNLAIGDESYLLRLTEAKQLDNGGVEYSIMANNSVITLNTVDKTSVLLNDYTVSLDGNNTSTEFVVLIATDE